jgi:hypothetical protein
MGVFHMNRAYNKGARPKIAPKKVSNFEDHMENCDFDINQPKSSQYGSKVPI